MTIHISAARRNAMLDSLVDAIDGGSPGTITIFSGSQPADATGADGTVLATFTLNNPSFGSASAGSVALVVSPALTCTASATGTAAWARVKTSGGTVIFDGSVATSGGDFTINSTSITSGQTVNLTAGSMAQTA